MFIHTILRPLFSAFFLGTVFSLFGQIITPIDVPRFLGASTVAGDTAYVFGGATPGLNPSNVISLYDRQTDTWSTALESLSAPRAIAAATATQYHVLVGGGIDPGDASAALSIVDIFDRASQEWTTANLSQNVVLPMVASNDTLAFFAGGLLADNGYFDDLIGVTTVDVFNSKTGTWSSMELSEPRGGGAGVRVGDYFIFAGGLINDNLESKRVDIYNAATGVWTIDSLSEARFFFGGTSDGERAYFGGGLKSNSQQSDVVDIFDPETGTWSLHTLSQARSNTLPIFSCGRIIFASGAFVNWNTRFITESYDNVDYYDTETEVWSSALIDQDRYGGFPVAFDDQWIIFSGFGSGVGYVNTAITYDCDFLTSNNELAPPIFTSWQVSPNPIQSGGVVRLVGPKQDETSSGAVSYQVIDGQGRSVLSGVLSGQSIQLPGNLPAGLYIIRLRQSGFSGQAVLKVMVD
jgi:hypothetical protein